MKKIKHRARPRPAEPRQPALTEHTFKANGKEYRLRYSVRAIATLQDHYELDSLDAVGDHLKELGKTGKIGVKDLQAILYAGLRAHHREVDMEEVLDIMDEIGLEASQTMIGSTFTAASPPADDLGDRGNDTEVPQKPGPSTG